MHVEGEIVVPEVGRQGVKFWGADVRLKSSPHHSQKKKCDKLTRLLCHVQKVENWLTVGEKMEQNCSEFSFLFSFSYSYIYIEVL